MSSEGSQPLSKIAFEAEDPQFKDKDYRLMLFDLSIHGHHANYIQYLIEYWSKASPPGYLDIVVSPQFSQVHTEVVHFAANQAHINFITISPQEEEKLWSRRSGLSRNFRNFQEWDLLCQYAHQLSTTQCLIMYFDTYTLPLVFGRNPPCLVSGIYFRPTFHYHQFSNHLSTIKDELQQWREKFLLGLVLRHRQLQVLFSLDPFAIKPLNHLTNQTKAIHLPDPVRLWDIETSQVERLRANLNITAGKKVFLLFGALTGRKGIYQLLEALPYLSDEISSQICLLLVGQADTINRMRIETQVAALCQSQAVQIIRHYEFISEPEVSAYFQLADIILAPYQKHVGMSGILLLAAIAHTPVLSSNYGLMGELVNRYHLGLITDTTSPKSIAMAIVQCLHTESENLCDGNTMQEFAEQNSVQEFSSTVFRHVS